MFEKLTTDELNTLTDKIYHAQERWYSRVKRNQPTRKFGQHKVRREWYTALDVHSEMCAIHSELYDEYMRRADDVL